MNKGTAYVNKIIKKRQQQRLLYFHRQNLKSVRPLNNKIIQTNLEPIGQINNKKKQMIIQDRFTEIERENRMLLQKISSIMNKKSSFKQEIKRKQSQQKQRMNKSLNQGFRRKQLEDIEIENAKMLKRLQQKKSDYDAHRLKQEWKKQKNVIKNLANYPFIIRDKIYTKKRKSMTSYSFNCEQINDNPHSLRAPIQLVRARNFNGINFIVTVKYSNLKLQIIGQNNQTKQIKVIQIKPEQALQFIHYECDGKIQGIFECLKYDDQKKIMYLMGKGVNLEVNNQEDEEMVDKIADQKMQKLNVEKQKMSKIYEEDTNKQDQSEIGHNFSNQNIINNQHKNNNDKLMKSHSQLQSHNKDNQYQLNYDKELEKDIKKENQQQEKLRNQQNLQLVYQNQNQDNSENIQNQQSQGNSRKSIQNK